MANIEGGPRVSTIAASADITSTHHNPICICGVHAHHHAIGLISRSCCGGRGFGVPGISAIAALVEGHGSGIESESFEYDVDHFWEFMTVIHLNGSVCATVGSVREG